jgi:uncharacterized protein
MKIARKITTRLVSVYQLFFSLPLKFLFGGGCRYYPTCSNYARDSVKKFGILIGGYKAVRRILRCNPLGGYGYDPVN